MKALWNKIVAWFKSKGGFVHVIAGAWAFFVFAYGADPQFHNAVLALHHSLPGWVEEIVTLMVSLFALYKTWNNRNI